MKGYIHSYESLGALDGPGLRTVVFLSGCPMRCKYCHNVDMLSPACGTLTSAEEAVARVLRYDSYIRRGGVTLSGGEPLFQPEFTLELLRRFKAVGLHTAIDTAGSVSSDQAKECLKEADLIILDVKHTDSAKYRELTGFPMDNFTENLDYIKKTGKRFWIRQVVVKGITDDLDEALKLVPMSAGADKIELLPYHSLGEYKWERMGLEYPLAGVPDTPPEIIEELTAEINKRFCPRLSDDDSTGDFGV